jgi:hypothetical protein
MAAEPNSVMFETTVAVTGNNTGIVVPEEAIEQLAAGQRPPRAGQRQRVRIPEHGRRDGRPPPESRASACCGCYRRRRDARRPGPLGTLPPSGSMHRWFPAVVTGPPISVSKKPSSCKNLVGATGFEPVTPRL